MDNYGRAFKISFLLLGGVVVLLALLRILLCAWCLLVPGSLAEVAESIATPPMMDLGLWAFVWYVVLELWWCVKMVVISAIVSVAIGLVCEGKWWTIILGLSLGCVCFICGRSLYNHGDIETPKLQVHGMRSHTYSFEQKGIELSKPSAADAKLGVIGYGIATKAADIRTDHGVIGHVQPGDTIKLLSSRRIGEEGLANYHSIVEWGGQRGQIADDCYDPIVEEVEYKDFLQQLFR